jgi:hypothetical protein
MKQPHKFVEILCPVLLAIIIVAFAATIISLFPSFDILNGGEYKFVLSFIGIITAFVIVSNYAQYKNLKDDFEKMKSDMDKQMRAQKRVKNALEYDKKFIFAKKLFLQNELAEDKKDDFIVELKPNYVKCNGFYESTVKIKSVRVENNKLKLIFCNPEVNLDDVICIRYEDVFNSKNDYSCYIDDPKLTALIEYLTKRKEEQNEQKNN